MQCRTGPSAATGNTARFTGQEEIHTGGPVGPISRRFFTGIVDPEGRVIGEPLTCGEGEVIADLGFARIDLCKRLMDARGALPAVAGLWKGAHR
ncbi:hypothetical protein ACIQ6K_38470 [Streptomyces sp. NPDC096354]|uniref:hypothetical protein n=1 Tax=Streptomyces sp. NPDC096354 TaxID=3366088 RepID=UPI00380A340F